jgi:hypothetical protein
VDGLGGAISDEYPDHVEAERVEVRCSAGEVVFYQGANGSLLAGSSGLEGSPKPVPLRNFTSTKTRVAPSRSTRSSSP